AEAEVLTRTGRRERGTLLEANPAYTHGFGDFVPELLEISRQVRAVVFEGEKP
ncbi:MAG: 2-amino-4-ketopentanoate thiolase, partial [Spirochaetaceae bacterium]|nr:2-amino-4-ketopentanoate thiolase [Spirochaetaceae bacterium]